MTFAPIFLIALFIPGAARRSTRVGDARHDAEQQSNTLAKGLDVSANVREARGLGTASLPRPGIHAPGARPLLAKLHWPCAPPAACRAGLSRSSAISMAEDVPAHRRRDPDRWFSGSQKEPRRAGEDEPTTEMAPTTHDADDLSASAGDAAEAVVPALPTLPLATDEDAALPEAVEQASGSAKPKSKTDRFLLQFWCNVCNASNQHSISRLAYTRGTVIVTCAACNSAHLVADNLQWIRDDFSNVEQLMAERGAPVSRVVRDGPAAEAAQTLAVPETADAPSPEAMKTMDGISADQDLAVPETADAPIPEAVNASDGISADQAARIREAFRARKRGAKGADGASQVPGWSPEQDTVEGAALGDVGVVGPLTGLIGNTIGKIGKRAPSGSYYVTPLKDESSQST